MAASKAPMTIPDFSLQAHLLVLVQDCQEVVRAQGFTASNCSQ